MNVFLSWSGETSLKVATALYEWLPLVVHNLTIAFSPEIDGGSRWHEVLDVSLEETDFGLAVMTAENRLSQFIGYECGAVAKSVVRGKVVPLFWKIGPNDLESPIRDFQGRYIDRDGIRRLVGEMNRAAGNNLEVSAIDTMFDHLWPVLEGKLEAIERAVPAPSLPQKNANELLEDLLNRVLTLSEEVRALTLQAEFTSRFIGDLNAASEESRMTATALDLMSRSSRAWGFFSEGQVARALQHILASCPLEGLTPDLRAALEVAIDVILRKAWLPSTTVAAASQTIKEQLGERSDVTQAVNRTTSALGGAAKSIANHEAQAVYTAGSAV